VVSNLRVISQEIIQGLPGILTPLLSVRVIEADMMMVELGYITLSMDRTG
jgi:hypothetical protein